MLREKCEPSSLNHDDLSLYSQAPEVLGRRSFASGGRGARWGWYANLLWIERRNRLMFTHSGTLFAFMVPDVRKAEVVPQLKTPKWPIMWVEMSRTPAPPIQSPSRGFDNGQEGGGRGATAIEKTCSWILGVHLLKLRVTVALAPNLCFGDAVARDHGLYADDRYRPGDLGYALRADVVKDKVMSVAERKIARSVPGGRG